MDLVPLVSNADNKIVPLMSNVNNNRHGPWHRVSFLIEHAGKSNKSRTTLRTNETALQPLTDYQDLARDNVVSRLNSCESHSMVSG